jgi:hypothetical protein
LLGFIGQPDVCREGCACRACDYAPGERAEKRVKASGLVGGATGRRRGIDVLCHVRSSDKKKGLGRWHVRGVLAYRVEK